MRIDLSDLDRLTGIAAALARLFWCLMALGFLTAILGSAGTGLFVLVLGGVAFVVRAGLEDFVRARRERGQRVGTAAPSPEVGATPRPAAGPEVIATARSEPAAGPEVIATARSEPAAEPEVTIYRTARRRRTRSAV